MKKKSEITQIGRRIEFRSEYGTIRYSGPLLHNPGGKPVTQTHTWLGIEWDNPGRGKHNGTVEGVQYFLCLNPPSRQGGMLINQDYPASLMRSDALNRGIPFAEALFDKYKSQDQMSKQEIENERRIEQEMYVNTTKQNRVNIELVGKEEMMLRFADVSKHVEIALQNMFISSISGENISQSLFNCEHLYLDLNLLSSWDEYFTIIRNIPKLGTLALTGNRLQAPSRGLFNDPNMDLKEFINPNLKVLVLIDMCLKWEDVEILSPCFKKLRELWLCRNYISIIYLKPEREYFENLRMLDLEENGISDFEEITVFKGLEKLEILIISINYIKDIYYPSGGFQNLRSFSMEHNLLNNWDSINELDKYPNLEYVRIGDNPLGNINGAKYTREMLIARVSHLRRGNGTPVTKAERRDAEIVYTHRAYAEYIALKGEEESKLVTQVDIANNGINEGNIPNNNGVGNKEIEDVGVWMQKLHPRWTYLCTVYGNPSEMIKNSKDIAGGSLDINSVLLNLECHVPGKFEGKKVQKKLPLTITISTLKGILSKLFKVPVKLQKLVYREEGIEVKYDIDDNLRELAFYTVSTGGILMVLKE